jgi:GNAT superfamily N-acetyltransferase
MIALDVRLTDAAGMEACRGELLDVYRDAYADKLGNPFFSEERYWERLEAYAQRTGFGLAMGYREGHGLVGYALGYTLPAGSQWWSGLLTRVDSSLVEEDGQRTFALNYIMVRRALRRQGIARQLHDALMKIRPEERATLLVMPGNVAASSAYAAWGWHKIGELQPFADAPIYDAMILDLRQRL